MKSTGVIRKLDELGRIVIPMELRNQFGLIEKDPMEIFVDGSYIILKKLEATCSFCGRENKIQKYKEKTICEKCIAEIKKM